MRFQLKVVFAAFISIILVSCGGAPPIGQASDIKVINYADLPPPEARDLIASARPYLIGPFDKLSIDVFGIPEISRAELQADASGQISMPLIGVVQAAGLTPGELGKNIEAKLRGNYVRDPYVSVNLIETLSQVVTVDGQVDKPGLYPVIGRMTLMGAVATAGGTSEFAKLNNVVVFRTVNDQKFAGLYDIGAIRNGNYPDPEIYANDIVIVGDSASRRIFKDLLQAAPLLTTPLIILFQK
ncbi:polysaccharide export protein [Sphingorhabdus lutea]|uniref:Polysaccharide export protein n=1 Tax=Sphingorhabdus lutea TaxID=1913578 RepID=A0A1L3JBJ8_9SPHN|nr:polysaccharide biosynthesis/export family protein [Sphingorhabdus lutea]APG62496.1 polysaccharide export protein [Sphingorhabdus lutea]